MDFKLLTKPADRITGREKVTGAAQYAGDYAPAGELYGRLVLSTVAKGRVTGMDVSEAEAVPGVRAVLTHETIGDYEPLECFYEGGLGGTGFWPMRDTEIRHAGQPVAYVVADTLESAREAAAKVRVDYAEEPAIAHLDDAEGEPKVADRHTIEVGDADAALDGAAHLVDEEYETPTQHHNPMEMFWTTVEPRGEHLHVYKPSQAVTTTKFALAKQLGMSPERVHVVSPLVGGAFGSKGTMPYYTTLTALAARKLARPVKLMVGRDQMYTVATYRPATKQKVRLGADADGKLVGYSHDEIAQTSRWDVVVNPGVATTTRMYACPAIRARELTQGLDVPTPGFMRAPNEVPPMFALECAMDELAWKLGRDPVEFRIDNDAAYDPVSGLPFSSRSLKECLRKGADAFGWASRTPEPGSMATEDELVGWGVATACYPTMMAPASARLRIGPGGDAEVELAAHDVGTGATTLMAMVAAERLGLPLARVSARLGRSEFPVSPIAGGSVTSASAGSAVWKAAGEAREAIAAAVTAEGGPLAGADPETLDFADGEVRGGGKAISLAEAVGATRTGRVEVTADWAHPDIDPKKIPSLYKGGFGVMGPVNDKHAMYAFGAEFVEVRINPRTKSIRVPRIVGAFAAGNILNEKAGRSQLTGGMIWGVGSALHEATETDRKRARWVNQNIAEYLVPVNADIESIESVIVPETDEYVNPLGAKGIGEIGIVGTAAAIANAVWHATGVRVRRTPIRMEDVLAAQS